MRVRLTPAVASAGGTRIFHVVRPEYDTETRQLVLVLRDGKLCLELLGQWQIDVTASDRRPHSCDEAERIYHERALVLAN